MGIGAEDERRIEVQKHMTLWLVGRLHPNWSESGWGFVGVFDTEEQARAASRGGENEISMIELNTDYGDSVGWPQDGDHVVAEPGKAWSD